VRLAWFSPLPPIPSGIADYSAELLPILAERAEVHVFSPRFSSGRRVKVPAGVAIHGPGSFRRRAERYDSVIYHLGNNPHHEFVYLAARERPGVAVFHELVLHHLIRHLYSERSRHRDRYRALLAEEYGDTGVRLAELRGRWVSTGLEPFLFPMIGHVARRSQAVVVHSQEGRDDISALAPNVPVTVIPHHAGAPPPDAANETRETARRELGLPGGAFVVGHFGFITIPKQPGAILRGFHKLLQRRPDAFLVLVGRDMIRGHAIGELIRRLDLAERIRMVGFVDLPGFYRYLNAVDAVVNLRYPSAGEASGTFSRAMAQGRAVIVNNVGSFAEVPGDAVLKVEVDGDQAEEVGKHLIRLAEDPAFKASLEERARRYAATALDPRRCAQLYLDVARSVAGRQNATVSS
jgi:glycosyltransferase involved in cell wall biosynthesis